MDCGFDIDSQLLLPEVFIILMSKTQRIQESAKKTKYYVAKDMLETEAKTVDKLSIV